MSALFGTYARSPIAFERGEGVRLFTAEGEEYLDFYAGIGVMALGHHHPALVKALKDGADKVWHVSNIFTIPESERLAQRLVDRTFADSVFFTNSGAEAVECAIKTARRHFWSIGQPERTEIICFTGSFHGRTLGTIAAGGNPSYLEGFGTPLPGFRHARPNDIEAVKAKMSDKSAAIMVEPVQGEGGITVMSEQFLRDLRQLCDDNGLLLILDEIQCGFGRTGKFFAYEWAGIEPDILCSAKAIGGGFPLGACLARGEVAKSMVPGTHGSTYGGNPLACTIGNAVLDEFDKPGFLDHVRDVAAHFHWHLQQMAQKFPDLVVEVRGKGLIAGLKVTPPVRDLVARVRDHHLLTVAASDNVLRMLPPLIITKDEIDEGFERLTAAFEDYRNEQQS
ncbi:MAG: aspartate aminotransferase family protein [Hyphomicrobiaceae bacterium]|nr:aspartate aminotransferase family protein [Hyphomicrobiaceae bacterium]MCC0022632.1 aspartate aminotransferase family protein [Hyphomicrobiaceae bacterium]